MVRRLIVAAAAAGLSLSLAAAFAAAPAGPPHMPAVQSEMKKIVDPNSTLLFAVGSEVDPENGPDMKPTPAARWNKAAASAATLKTAGDWLRKPGVGKTAADWTTAAADMTRLSGDAAKAAQARNGKALAQAANDLSDTCTACHKVYKPQTG